MSLTLKISSLFVRTLAKPIANYIKHNAREHERFRKLCVSFAQNLHRVDMRLRLGLLQDPAVIEKQIAKEVAEAEAKRLKASQTPTVRTEAESKAAEVQKAKDRESAAEKAKRRPRIRPLSEAKAIETGANFISETFMFMVAGGVIIFESWRSRRKENNRREDVADRLESLETKVIELTAELESERSSHQPGSVVSEKKDPKSSDKESDSGQRTTSRGSMLLSKLTWSSSS